MADILFRDTDPDEFRRQLAAEIADQVRAVLADRFEPRLVPRCRMAELASIGTATLDNLVTAGKVPSVLIGRRRLFEPAKVIEALASNA